MAVLTRLCEYGRIAWRMAAYGLLVSFWGVFLVAFVAHMAPRFAYLEGRPIGDDLPCHKPECDFSIFWSAGQLARAHEYAVLYDPVAFPRLSALMLGTQARLEPFLYPPPMLLPATAAAHLPFEYAAFLWMFGSLALAAVLLRVAGFSWLVIAAGLLSPAALLSTEIGQAGVLTGALLVAGVLLIERRPALAGAGLGLLAVKPQIGILVPFLFLSRHRVMVAAGFAAMVGALMVLVTLVFGPQVWSAFITADHAAGVLGMPFDPHAYQGWGVSVFWMARSFGAGLALSGIVQAVATVGAIAALVCLSRRGAEGPVLAEMAVYLSLLATPYGFTYDMVAYSLVLAEAARHRNWRIGMLDTALWLWPGFCLVVSIATGVVLTPVFVFAALLRAALRRREAVLPPRPTGA